MSVQFSLGELAEKLEAQLRGSASYVVAGIASITEAGPKDISFLSQASYEKQLADCSAGAVILKAASADKFAGNVLIVRDPYYAYAKLSALFDPRPRRAIGIHARAVVADSAQIDPSASIGANCVIGDDVKIGANTEIYPGVVISEGCQIGNDCLLHANVTLYANVHIANNVIIHSGSVIGSDGFGYAPCSSGWQKIHQLGGVRIGNNVEIGANTAIDCGALGNTTIRDGVIIDNQVHLGHNVDVGENTAIAGCVGVAGSTTIGKNCLIAGFVAINGHITIADQTQFNGGTIVTKGVDTPGGVYASAAPMLEVSEWRRASVRYKQLDELASRVKQLEKAKKS